MTSTDSESRFTSVEICAGAGGQALGLHRAGFRHHALIEIDENAVRTLEENTKGDGWEGCRVLKRDLTTFDVAELDLSKGTLDLLAGGVPCPPFSAAGKQLGQDDERDLFPTMLQMVADLRPKAVMIENVRGLLEPAAKFKDYRENTIERRLIDEGYKVCMWQVLEAWHFGVPQLRPRAILVALLPEYAPFFVPFEEIDAEGEKEIQKLTVGHALETTMRLRYGAVNDPRADKAFKDWFKAASADIAPTLVGGSKKHGGADLGPTRAKRAWGKLGVDGLGVANDRDKMVDKERDLFSAAGPKLTVEQAAIIQGFPTTWRFMGKKTAAYRQVGNAFPPPMAEAVGKRIKAALEKKVPGGTSAGDVVTPEIPRPSASEAADRGGDREGAGLG
ncbi:DNA (cytosine-5-)-methyltransferase [Streptomyces sp. NBC_01310]|uniref:DNA cytosine methyltransferase n=1 Tax=Streptomyces sp. NBC_01310 TaxID=2903820 RepID=UPI0035B64697|nr:DNA (cytosine-5-)-methyltransferase [Streptomyces sp. NBC_01310]